MPIFGDQCRSFISSRDHEISLMFFNECFRFLLDYLVFIWYLFPYHLTELFEVRFDQEYSGEITHMLRFTIDENIDLMLLREAHEFLDECTIDSSLVVVRHDEITRFERLYHRQQ